MQQLKIQEYHGDDGQTVIFLAIIKKESIGRAEVLINDEQAFLKDISVTKIEPGRSWFPPFYTQGANYRGKGVGSALMAEVFAHCESLDVKEITGVMQGDIEFLSQWYQKHGFEVLEEQRIRHVFAA